MNVTVVKGDPKTGNTYATLLNDSDSREFGSHEVDSTIPNNISVIPLKT